MLPDISVLLSVLKMKEANFVNNLNTSEYGEYGLCIGFSYFSSQTTSENVGRSPITLLIAFPNPINIPSVARRIKTTQEQTVTLPPFSRSVDPGC